MVNLPVLVINQSYEPLSICKVRRAVVLVYCGKAEVIENGRGSIHSVIDTFDVPSVIRLAQFVKRPRQQRRMTRLEVFNRDKYVCQYCGRETGDLTLDHVVPKWHGGEHSWENVVSACIPCNRRKAGRTPKEAGMPLIHQPQAPHNDGFRVPYQYIGKHIEWQKYLPR